MSLRERRSGMWVREDAKHDRAAAVPFSRICASVLGAVLVLAAYGVRAQPAAARIPLPPWAESRWSVFAQSHRLQRIEPVAPSLLHGDFDGDGRRDVASSSRSAVRIRRGLFFCIKDKAARTSWVLATNLDTLATIFSGWIAGSSQHQSPRAFPPIDSL